MVKLITDSGADLPEKLTKEYDIHIIPFYFYIDDKEFRDGDLSLKEFYDEMRAGKKTKTAQLTYMDLRETFEHYAKEQESVIYMCFSSQLSGTYQTACMVKDELLEEYPDFDLEIIDTKCASLGQGMAVYRTARLLKQGYDKESLLRAARFYAGHTEHIFTVDDLKYLERGGRVSKTSAFVGTMLHIKPILHVDDGKLIPIRKVRGRKKVHKNMFEIVKDRGINLDKQVIGINHGDDYEGANKLKEMIADNFGTQQFVEGMIGSVIGAHSGPGTLSVYFLNEFPEEFQNVFDYE
ncbi:DegV family protein [Natranaerobius thermophilus]|uniref:DegV family protein n=1 Tax=Natranaerobius thermophilus (strain ATCC BAA-1301 / DSM 18059 / JW/NM-WN-LF) TaxID=457570 RepID=B2A856_NATTJ|nr:DegV family protein [Natranaerobius thermophilus]ACB85824.1 degV family protein [Natranaerobius thermophilus JW/NM-WN-LF]